MKFSVTSFPWQYTLRSTNTLHKTQVVVCSLVYIPKASVYVLSNTGNSQLYSSIYPTCPCFHGNCWVI